MMMNRRRWLKVGVAGGAALGVAAWWAQRPSAFGRTPYTPAANLPPAVWTPEAAMMIKALAPVVIGPACTGAASCQRVAEGVRVAVAALSPAAQRDVGELFMLLNIGPARGLLTGVWGSWSDASTKDIEAFLQRWRHSRLALLQAGYHALHDLILAAWYAEPESWAAIGYPGPPALAPVAA